MRNTLVSTLLASMFGFASMMAIPSDAKSQVVVIIGNGAAQPYYPAPHPVPYPYPRPYPYPHVLYGAGSYPGYGYATSDYSYYSAGGYGYPSGYYDGYYDRGYYSHY